jgi:hypothetical protein
MKPNATRCAPPSPPESRPSPILAGVNANAILYPMIVLVFWTFVVLLLIPRRRFGAARERLVSARDFAFGESENVPGEVRLPNRNYMNLLELPVLFYLACITLVVTGRVEAWSVGLAWAFVVARIAHSLVHLTYNNVFHRLRIFAVSVVLLMVLWLRVLVLL